MCNTVWPYRRGNGWDKFNLFFWMAGNKSGINTGPRQLAEQVSAYLWYCRTMRLEDPKLIPLVTIVNNFRESRAYKYFIEGRKNSAANLYQHREPIAGTLPDPLDSEIATQPTIIPEWYTRRCQNMRNNRMYQLPTEILTMIFEYLDEGEQGVARQACSRFIEIISKPRRYHPISYDTVDALSPPVRRKFEDSKRTRFNLYPITPQQLLYGYGVPEYLRPAREAFLWKQMCADCQSQPKMYYKCIDRTGRYCSLCEHDQPNSAFLGRKNTNDLGHIFQRLVIQDECRLKEMSIRMCEHTEHKIPDVLAAGNAAIELRLNRGIFLWNPDSNANAQFGRNYSFMTEDNVKLCDDHVKKHGGPMIPSWLRPRTRGAGGWAFRDSERRARLATIDLEFKYRKIAPRGLAPRDLPKSDSGEYVQLWWCDHASHAIADSKPPPPGFSPPRIVMVQASKKKPGSLGSLSMIWCGHMFDLPSNEELTREKLVELIAGLNMDKVPTVCPHVKKLGLKQLALPFAEYQCCCFDAPANVTDPHAMPVVAHKHPWTQYNSHIADYQRADKRFRKNKSNCLHEPGSDKCCRCYNDDRPGARHTSKRTLMPEWTVNAGETPPRLLHAYHCNMCETVYAWQRSGRSLFLETRKEVRIDAVDERGWPTGATRLPGQMFAQYADPEEMLYKQHKGPRRADMLFCEDDNCIVRHDTRVWKEMMHMDPDAGVGRSCD